MLYKRSPTDIHSLPQLKTFRTELRKHLTLDPGMLRMERENHPVSRSGCHPSSGRRGAFFEFVEFVVGELTTPDNGIQKSEKELFLNCRWL
jgi:hypothetical protein